MSKAPKLFYIDHPLTRIHELSDEVCASFTDEQIEEYKALYDQYLTMQRVAASTGVDLAQQLRELVDALFQDQTTRYEVCKQRKYIDRMIRNGETVVDLHSKRYPKPTSIVNRIEKARERYGDLANARVTVGGDDTLQEINNAVTFLLGKGMTLNTDFTVSNAVGIAKGIAKDDIHQKATAQSENEYPGSLDGYALMVNDEAVEATRYGLRRGSGYRNGYLYLMSVSLEGAPDIDLQRMEISFQESAVPTIKVKH